MVKIRFTAILKDITEKNGADYAQIHVKGEHTGDDVIVASFMSELMIAILRAMRDTNKDAFYKAMAGFANDDMDNAMEWTRGHLDD